MPVLYRCIQGRHHGVDWGGHVHPTFARGRSWDWCKSGEILLGRRGLGSVMVWSLTCHSLPYVAAPGPRWGLRPQTPVIGSASCARHVCPPNIFWPGNAPGCIHWLPTKHSWFLLSASIENIGAYKRKNKMFAFDKTKEYVFINCTYMY